MGKIKLLLNTGTCFSATSPFHYTVSWDHKCVYTGHTKEHMYLFNMMVGEDNIRLDGKRPKPNVAKKRKKPDLLTHLSPYVLGKWTKEEENRFFHDSLSIENYIWYYKKHWENCKHDYEWVGDFSNQNALLSIPFMMEIKDALLEHFDIKVTMQFRDPVRRLFSVANKCVKNHEYGDMTPIQVMYKWLSGAFEPNAYYSSIYRRHALIWGVENVRAIVMEELWNPETQKEELGYLSDFLGYNFTKVHENVYYPDMGSNPPKYEYLSDQYNSDKVDITDDEYKTCARLMKSVYAEFEKTFGYVPDEWNK
tara:strand:+ start:2106 stop:3029 length:924 start_codon:yes stop_codon:yes gene_type:complete